MNDTKKAAPESGKAVEIFADVLGEVQQLQKQALFLLKALRGAQELER